MAEESAKLRIPYIAASQAQKHVTHNEAMTLLDTLVQLAVLDKDLTAPPAEPEEGDTYIVAAGATGAWLGWDDRVARFIDGTWRSYLPGAGDGAGWTAYVIDEAALYVFNGTSWGLFSGGGGGGATDFTDLGDVPAAYTGHGGKALAVTPGADGVEFVAFPGPGAQSATISAGAVTVTSTASPLVLTVDTEAAAATDDLDTISGGFVGQLLIVRSNVSARDVTLRDDVDNLRLASNLTLATNAQVILMIKLTASSWVELSRSSN